MKSDKSKDKKNKKRSSVSGKDEALGRTKVSSISAGSPKALSKSKKLAFWLVTLLFPLIILVLLEVTLRIFNYGGNLDLFIEGPEGYENYIRCNPDVARRYFYMQSSVPTPPKQLFLKEKPKNSYRIFVLGESTTAGFPYGNNVSFPNVLERGLSNAFAGKNIEVISVAMAAINSYTLLDFADEIFKQSPDALLIYTGHNEYYGALGVGSLESIGNSPWFVKTYLKLQSVKTFLLMRNVIGWIKNQFNHLFYKGTEIDPSATLMERIVAEQTIPYGSSLYEAGKEQFKENMDEILSKAASHGVKVILSELVSNLGDQEPFISVEDKQGNSANSFFKEARQYASKGDYENARRFYFKAKDMDALRFRAPEDFNLILKELAKKYSAPVVPMLSNFEKESVNGIIGNKLMLEHLHPNKDGYFLLAKGFYDVMQENHFISNEWPQDCITREHNQGITELDSVYAALVIMQLKESWPFKPKSLPNHFLQYFKPANHLEEVAFHILSGPDYSLESAHMDLGIYYEKNGDPDKAFLEYNSLITSIPTEVEFYQRAATVLLSKKEYEKASLLLHKSLRYNENSFAYKWIGQIALINNNYKDAISFLTKADLGDSQVLFNLSRAFYSDDQWYKGEEYFKRLYNLSPKSEYVAYLKSMRTVYKLKHNSGKPF